MKKAVLWLILILNGISIGFTIYYSCTFRPSVAANIFGVLLIATFVLDCTYAAFLKRRAGGYYLVFYCLTAVISLVGNHLSVLPVFRDSVGYAAIVCMLLQYGAAMVLCFMDLTGREERPLKKKRAYAAFRHGTVLVAMVLLFAFAWIAWDVLFNYGYSQFELYIGGLLFYLALIAYACTALVARYWFLAKEEGTRLNAQSVVCVILTLALGLYACAGYTVPMLANTSASWRVQTNSRYAEAFGTSYLKQDKTQLRPVTFSVPEFFMGIKTTGYESETDVLYFESTEGIDKGIRLSYDVHYPDLTGDAPRPVLIRMHGRSGDKGSGNYPGPNKYFASRGYVVYDIQYGGFNEKQDTPHVRDYERTNQDYVNYVRAFVTFAKAHNNHNADWNSVFVSGNSFGGAIADAFALSVGGNPDSDPLGITIKGLIPIYPSSDTGSLEPMENPTLQVKKDSPPCLMYMGTHDGYVDRGVGSKLLTAYRSASNPAIAIIEPHYAGHGSDGYFYGYNMQSFLYYMERFMAQYR